MFQDQVWIKQQLNRHYSHAKEKYSQNQIVGNFVFGSFNYQLNTLESDVDTKLIVLPSFDDIVKGNTPISTTHVIENGEHLEAKDIRLYFETFRKQNLNFMEILFTDFFYLNLNYQDEWLELVKNRESIARMNPVRAVRSMAGLAERKFKNMEHMTPANKPFIEKYGYVPKELYHLERIKFFLADYIEGLEYKSCMVPEAGVREYLKAIKQGGYNLEQAKRIASGSIYTINQMMDNFCIKYPEEEDHKMRKLLDDVCYEIMRKGLRDQLMTGEQASPYAPEGGPHA